VRELTNSVGVYYIECLCHVVIVCSTKVWCVSGRRWAFARKWGTERWWAVVRRARTGSAPQIVGDGHERLGGAAQLAELLRGERGLEDRVGTGGVHDAGHRQRDPVDAMEVREHRSEERRVGKEVRVSEESEYD